MAKKKKKQKKLSEQIVSKKVRKEKKNPFEMRINREKHDIIGRKKHKQIGLPGISHSTGIQKRKDTLLKEYTHRNKNNYFRDKRIQNKDKEMVYKSYQRTLHKNSIYNLNDEEELTHHGRTVSEIEMFDKNEDSEDEDQLRAEFVKDAHFGGFLTEKKNEEEVKSRKEYIQDIIADKKKQKYEKQKERESTIEMTEKLDTDWKGIHSLFSKMSQKVNTEKSDVSSYDLTVHELKFEMKGKATDQLKKPEELKREQEEKLKSLERDRKARMDALISEQLDNVSRHISADSILSSNSLSKNKNNVTENLQESDDIHKAAEQFFNFKDNKSENIQNDKSKQIENLFADKFVIPSTQEEFLKMLSEHKDISEFLKQIMIKLKECNNSRIYEVFFEVLLEYTLNIADEGDLTLLDILIPNLYDIAEVSPNTTAQHILTILLKAEQKFQNAFEKRKCQNAKYPKFSTAILLKLCGILYPTSDFRHQIATPATVFLMRLIAQCYVKSIQDILYGLFLCSVALNYVSYSKRYLPEVLNFLIKILGLAVPNEKETNLLIAKLKSKIDMSLTNAVTEAPKLKLSDVRKYMGEFDDCSKVQIIKCTIDHLISFATLYNEYPSFIEAFSSVKHFCQKLPVSNFPETLKEEIENLVNLIESFGKRQYLTQPSRPVKSVRFLEPRIQDNFSGRKIRQGGKKKLEKERLMHRYKKEMKGAIREVRRDNYFLANHWLKEQSEKDAERKRKVKELYNELAIQESTFKSLKKKK